MTIALINTSDRTGGAALACNSLYKALKSKKLDVRFLVRDKTSKDDLIKGTNHSTAGKIRKDTRPQAEASQPW